MNLALKLFLKYHPRQQSKVSQTTDGFTMIELLIGTIMAFLIITPLLGFVVSVLNDDTREQAKSATDFEQQAAISFISEDLGQAYYIYSDAKEQDDGGTVDEIQAIQGDLPGDGTPILVFWKQQTIPNSRPFNLNDSPSECTPNTCDDTTVRALVSYYLVDGEEGEIWCEPGNDNCPQRIVRYVMKEDLEKYRGTGVGFGDGQLKDSQQGNVVFSTEFSLDNPTENIIEREIEEAGGEVLINYISSFEVSNVPPTSDSATVTMKSDGKRRTDAGKNCEADETSAFCPKATVTVEGLTLELN